MNNSNRKFELVPDQSINFFGRTLFRIRALRDFGNVRAGDIGGYIESERNLSHDGNAWVCDNALVYGDARVFDNARVFGDAQVYGNALVSDNARVFGNAQVSCDAQVFGNAWVSGNAQVFGNAWVYGDARVFGNAWVYGDARVFGDARMYGDTQVSGNAQVYSARVSGNAQVSGDARVYGDASLCWLSNVGSEYGTLTAFTALSGITVTRGCFFGTLEEFEAAVKKTHGNSRIAAEYSLLIQFIRMRLGDAQARLAQHNHERSKELCGN